MRFCLVRSSLMLLAAVLCWQPVPVSANEDDDLLARFEERRQSIARLMENATVYVLVDQGGSVSMGSGFVVADGYIMTNAHVVEEAQGNTILIMNSVQEPTPAKIVKMDYSEAKESDFALLKYTPGARLPILSFNLQPKRMDRVSAWGFPFLITKFDQSIDSILEGELKTTPPVVFTEGVLSTLVEKNGRRTIIHTASIASGNSGGPLINSKGEVIGINTWISKDEDEGAYVNAALPAERIVEFLRQAGLSPLLSRQAPLGSNLAESGTPNRPVPPSGKGIALGEGHASGNSGGSKAEGLRGGTPQDSDEDSASLSLAELERLAGQGESQAELALGMAYWEGDNGAPQDLATAMRWLNKASDHGNSLATGMLGLIYITEEKVFDPQKGLKFVEKSASAQDGDPAIQSFLALLYYEGESYGIERDVDKCFTWAGKASQGDDADAKALLGRLYYFGEGVDQDQQKALELARDAVRGDSTLGKSLLAWMYYHGEVVPEDLNKALQLAREAAESEDASAQGLLACMYYEGQGVDEDDKTAEGWARRAADQANEFGQYILGLLYMSGSVVDKDPVQAWAYLDMAAQKSIDGADKQRDTLASEMNASQLDQARKLQQSWKNAWKRGA